MNAKFSIIIANYNGAKYLRETLPALESLSCTGLVEIIVIDGHSTDGSTQLLTSWASEPPAANFRRVYASSTSPYPGHKNAMCHQGVNLSTGHYLWITDNDILPSDPLLLEHISLILQDYPQVGCIVPALINKGATTSKWYGRQFGLTYLQRQQMLTVPEIQARHLSKCGIAALPFLRRSWWDTCGGYDTTLIFGGDDDDLGLHTWQLGREVRVYAHTLCIHLGQAEKDNPIKFRIKWARNIASFYHTVIKNYPAGLLLPTLVTLTVYLFAVTLIYAVRLRSLNLLLAYPVGLLDALRRLPASIAVRKQRTAQGQLDSAYWEQ